MADVYNPNQDEENQQQPGQVQQVPGGSLGAPAAPGGQMGASRVVSGTGQGGQGQQTGSGRFTNIQKYLKANQGVNVGQQLGEKIQEQSQAPMAQIGSARQELQQNLQSEQGRLGQAGDLFNRVKQFAGPAEQGQPQGQTIKLDDPYLRDGSQSSPLGIGQQAAPAPTLTDADYAAFAQLRQGQSATPEVANLAQLEAGAGNISKLAEQAGTEQGRFGLLQQFYGRPTYSTGQQRLDQLLLQTAPQQGRALQTGAAQTARQTQAQLDALKNIQSQGASDIAAQTAARQAEAQQLIGDEEQKTGLLGGLRGSIEQRTQEQQAQADLIKDTLTKAFTNQGLGSQENVTKALQALQSAGINPEQLKVYDLANNPNFRPEQFLNSLQISPEAVATQDERAKLEALYKLSGKSPTFLTGPAQAPVDMSKVFNTQALQDAAASRKAEYESQITPYGTTDDFSRAITSGRFSPSAVLDNLKKYGLSNEAANAILQSREFAGQPGGPGMHAQVRGLAGTIPLYQAELDRALAGAAEGMKRQYGVGKTLKDLINEYTSLPTSGTNFGTLPTASGPAGKIGLF